MTPQHNASASRFPVAGRRRRAGSARLAGAAVASASALAVLGGGAARGAITGTTTYTNAAGDGLFTSAADFTNGAPTTGLQAIFPAIAAPVTSLVTVPTSATTGTLQLNDAYNLSSTAGATLTVGDGATAGDTLIDVETTGTALIAGPSTTVPGLALAVSGAVNVAAGGTLTVSSDITQTTTGVVLIKTGAGTLRLRSVGFNGASGANEFSGGLQLNAGTVDVTTLNALGGTVASSNATNGAITTTSTPLIFNGGQLLYNPGTGFSVATSRVFAVSPAAGAFNVSNTNTATLNNAIANTSTGSGVLTKTGLGTVALGTATSNSSSALAGVTISGGTVRVNGLTLNVLGTAAASPLTLDGGTLALNNTLLSAGGTRGFALTANNGTVSDVAGEAFTFTGAVTGPGRLNAVGPGAFTFSSTASTYTGGLNVSGGATFATQTTVDFGAAPSSLVADYLRLDNGTVNYTDNSGTVILSGNRGLTLAAGGGTFNVSGAAETLVQSAAAVGTGAFAKIGDGTFRFAGADTYTGPTNVSGGTLRDNGTHTSAGSYTIGGAGTYGGSGTLTLAAGGSVTDVGVFSPGAANGSIGTMTVNGDLALTDGTNVGQLAIDVNTTAASPVDRVVDNGTLNITGASVTFNLAGASSFSAPLVFASYTTLVGGAFADTAALAAQGYTIDYNYQGLNQIALTGFTAVPEPASLGLLAAAGGAALLRRRRRA